MSEDRIRRWLSEDPRVLSAVIEPGLPDGLVARVTPDPRWLREARVAAHAALGTRMLRQWQMVFDRTYRLDNDSWAPGFAGWISSFTGERMSQVSMQAWLDDTLAQLRAVPHARVLDIGCGVGLVAAALAPDCSAYDASDMSEEAIAALGAWLGTQPALRHVRLAQRAAHEIDGPPGTIDLVVLNSVVQYFPDLDYLRRVLDAAAARLAPGGHIFLGDIRALGLLPVQAAAVAATRAPAGATMGAVEEDRLARLDLARELALDTGLFATLPGVTGVRFSLKPAAADPELAAYRFDAMLRFGGDADGPAPSTLDWTEIGGDLAARIGQLAPAAVAVTDIPNARVASHVALARRLATAPPGLPFEDVAAPAGGVAPEAVAAAAAQLGYAAAFRFTPGSAEGRFDALLQPVGAPQVAWPSAASLSPHANDPLGAELAAALRRELQHSLDQVLGKPGLVRVML